MSLKLITKESFTVAGFTFFGNPFEESSEWTEENEIGNLWKRFFHYLEINPHLYSLIHGPKAMFEIHIKHPQSETKGFYEIFVGFAIDPNSEIPLQMVRKTIPGTTYAVVTLAGEQIFSGDEYKLSKQWAKENDYKIDDSFSFQFYDDKFKGMDKIPESSLDFYIPLTKLND